MPDRHGIVILAGPDQSTNWIYHGLRSAVQVHRVIIEQPVSRARLLRRRAQTLGWAAVAGQVLFMALAIPLLRRCAASRAAQIRRDHGLDSSPIPPEVLTRVPSANSDEVIALLAELRPAVVVLNGTRIIARRVLEAADCPVINMHAGITPLYRGVHGGYWALAQSQPDACGVTVHLVDTGIDTGGILGQALIRPEPADNFATYPLLQVAAGLPLLREAAVTLAMGEPPRTIPAPAGESRLWSHPTLCQYLANRRRRGVK